MSLGGYTLKTLSQCAHTIASREAHGFDGAEWNRRYVAKLAAIGFELVPVLSGQFLGEDGPIWAPLPCDGGDKYPYPCVIAPVGWISHPPGEAALDDGAAAVFGGGNPDLWFNEGEGGVVMIHRGRLERLAREAEQIGQNCGAVRYVAAAVSRLLRAMETGKLRFVATPERGR